jgi:hypothetical protein
VVAALAVPPAGIGAAAPAAWLSDCPWAVPVLTDGKEAGLVVAGAEVPYCATAGAAARRPTAPNVSNIGINAVFTKLSSLPNQPSALSVPTAADGYTNARQKNRPMLPIRTGITGKFPKFHANSFTGKLAPDTLA